VKLIVGLGNPGPTYRGTRHNVGFEVIDELGRRRGLVFESGPTKALIARDRSMQDVMLAKPLTFMNRSGQTVADLQRYYRFDLGEVLIVVEDAALPLGRLRARANGSGGGHRGLRSVVDALGTEEFARLRVGVGRGDPQRDLVDHVLSRFEPTERGDIEAAIERAADAVVMFTAEGIEPVMNTFNRKDSPADEGDDQGSEKM
jgi:PTH1 family peptidyl-tRNA hydrolase